MPERLEVREGAVRYEVDPWNGQKTGLFLDQRENREAALRYARGRLLDAFSYNGGFALALAPRCESVLAVDISADAVARIRANAARNGIGNVEAREMNVFDELRELERTRRALRHHRPRPAGLREEQERDPKGDVRLQGDQPARAEAADARAGSWSRAAAPTT